MTRLNETDHEAAARRRNSPPWHKQIAEWKAKAPFGYRVTEEVVAIAAHDATISTGKESEVILPQMVIEMLYELTKGEAIITTGVGQHQMWAGAILQIQIPAPASDQRRPGLDGLRLSRRARREGRLPGQAGDRHRRRRLVPDERAGTGHGAHREDRRQGDHPEQPAPRHGGAMGRQVLRGQPRPHLSRRPGKPEADLSGLRRDGEELQRAVRARDVSRRTCAPRCSGCWIPTSRTCST